MLAGYSHAPGDHCGSTALRNLADHYDWNVTEPQCFGIGAGIGFSYHQQGPASRMIMGRSSHLETAFFDHFGISTTRRDGRSQSAWDDLRTRLRDGPVVCFVDLYYLPYYETETHFGPHTVVVTGVEDATVTVSDSEFPELQTVSRDEFLDAWSSSHGLDPVANRWLAVDDPQRGESVDAAVRAAVGRAVETMLHESDRWGGPGVAAMEEFSRELPSWNALEAPRWTARFAYQNIQRRGTGGGAFRRLYADFLAEHGASAGLDDAVGTRMHDIADAWERLADVLKVASETDDDANRAEHFQDAAALAGEITDREAALFSACEGAI